MKQNRLTNVFDGWEETLIWSCLQGIKGEVYTNDAGDAAMATTQRKSPDMRSKRSRAYLTKRNWNRQF